MEMIADVLGMAPSEAALLAAGVLARGAALLALCFGVAALLRRSPAALRHHVWVLGMIGLVALPFASSAVPAWSVSVPGFDAYRALIEWTTGVRAEPTATTPAPAVGTEAPARGAAPAGTVDEETVTKVEVVRETVVRRDADASQASGIPWAVALFGVWAAGALVLLGRLAFGLVEAARLVRRGRPVTDRRWSVLVSLLSLKTGLEQNVRVVESSEVNVPMAWGLADSWLVLPEGIEDWPEDRRRVVVLHELAHLRRRDCLLQALARVALALHWPNPLAWIAVRRMCSEREQACDDAVLAAGVGGPAYAHHLVDIARGLTRAARPTPAAVAMARPSELENRVLAILDDRRARQAVGRRATRLGLAAFALLLLPLAAIRPTAAAPGPDASGTPPAIAPAKQDAAPDDGPATDRTQPVASDAGTSSGPDAAPGARVSLQAEGGVGRDATLGLRVAAEADLGDVGAALAGAAADLLHSLQEAPPDTIEERVHAALVRALRSEDASVRRQAANTLGVIESPRAVEALSGVLRADDSPAVRREAAWALGMIESAEGVAALTGAVRDADPAVREQAVWALGMIESPDGVAALVPAAEDSDPEIRAQVAWALGMIESDEGVEALVGLLDDPDAHVRSQAAWGLGMIESSRAVDGLALAFDREADPGVRSQIVWALGMIEDRGGIDTVIDALEDDDADVRDKALWALGMIMG